jgi:prephenate dehydrogenase
LNFNSISIVGLGLIGGSFAKAIKHANKNIFISAFDNRETLEKAEADSIIDNWIIDLKDALNSDIVFLALPLEESLNTFRLLSPYLKKNQIISDLCSVKGIFADEWKKMDSEGIYIGSHPMTGKEKSGYDNSDALLFENSIFIICSENIDANILESYFNLIRLTGARIAVLNSYLHDGITSRVSHLPQLLSVLLVNQLTNKNEKSSLLDFAAGGFRDMTRVASSDFTIWESIIKYNKDNILDSLSIFENQISQIKTLIEDKKFDEINDLFEKARITRNEIPINNKGFIDPLFDITIFVKDQPGMISKLSTILFENNINIKDIELLKIREGTGGNFKFYFESAADAEKANELIENIGYHIR